MLTTDLTSCPMHAVPLPMAVRAQPPATTVPTRFISAGPEEFRGARYTTLTFAPGTPANRRGGEGRRAAIANNPTAAVGIYDPFAAGYTARSHQWCRNAGHLSGLTNILCQSKTFFRVMCALRCAGECGENYQRNDSRSTARKKVRRRRIFRGCELLQLTYYVSHMSKALIHRINNPHRVYCLQGSPHIFST
jgi:hypothetical protein